MQNNFCGFLIKRTRKNVLWFTILEIRGNLTKEKHHFGFKSCSLFLIAYIKVKRIILSFFRFIFVLMIVSNENRLYDELKSFC